MLPLALRPTIYKLRIELSDLNRDYYDSLNLTVAQHPSETLERMLARALAYCINAQENLSFTKGLSQTDEPELWVRTLDDSISLWIDVGEPDVERIKKATRVAREVRVYSFNSKSDVWWSQNQSSFAQLNARVFQFSRNDMETLANWVQRTMDWSVTISGDSAYVATEQGQCELSWRTLQ